MISLLVPLIEFFLRDVDGLRLLRPCAGASVPETVVRSKTRAGGAGTTYLSVVSVSGGGQIATVLPLLSGFVPAWLSFLGLGTAFCFGAWAVAVGGNGLGGTITCAALITAPPL